MEKIYDAFDYAKREGHKGTRSRVRFLAKKHRKKIVENVANDKPVNARIDFGRWIADCECGGAEAVDPRDAVFYCVSCGNGVVGGQLRPVNFPANRKEIEDEVLRRSVVSRKTKGGIDAALNAVGPISRSWSPGESVEDLRMQREAVRYGSK